MTPDDEATMLTWLMKAGAATYNCACYMHAECCWCDDGQVHRPKFPQRFPPDITVYEDDTLDDPVDPATCPHCCCTYTTECCYCDGSRTPLENQ